MPAQTDSNARRGILIRTTPADQGLVRLPALAPHLQFHDIGERQTLLVSESFNTLLHGELHRDLLPLLDGGHPLDEIVGALEGAHAAVDVLAAIVSLSAKGYVVSAEHGMDRGPGRLLDVARRIAALDRTTAGGSPASRSKAMTAA